MERSSRPFLYRYAAEGSIFLLALCLRLGYWLYTGTRIGGDWGGYSDACAVWATDPLAILTAHKGVFYAGFTFPFCHLTALPGTTLDTWVAVQITLSAAACVIIYRTGRILIGEVAGLVAGFGLAVLWDSWLWTTLLYSTAMFNFAMVCCLWALARYHRSGSQRARLAVFGAVAFLSISHPMGPPIALGWILYDVKPTLVPTSRPLFDTRTIPTAVGVSAVGLLGYATQRYGLLGRWNRGEVVYADPTYAIPVEPAASLVDFVVQNHVYAVAIPVARVLLFFVPFFPRNSTARIALNLATYTPMLLVASYGAYRAWTDRRELFRYLVTPALMLLTLTAVYTVSWDLRYRSVLGPCIVLLTGYVVSVHLPDRLHDRIAAFGRTARPTDHRTQ